MCGPLVCKTQKRTQQQVVEGFLPMAEIDESLSWKLGGLGGWILMKGLSVAISKLKWKGKRRGIRSIYIITTRKRQDP